MRADGIGSLGRVFCLSGASVTLVVPCARSLKKLISRSPSRDSVEGLATVRQSLLEDRQLAEIRSPLQSKLAGGRELPRCSRQIPCVSPRVRRPAFSACPPGRRRKAKKR